MAGPAVNEGSGQGTAPSWRSRRRAVAILLVVVIVTYGTGVVITGAQDVLAAVDEAAVPPLGAAVLAQVVVALAWPLVHRGSVRATGASVRYRHALNASMSAFTVSHTLPGGGALGAAVVVERLTAAGVPAAAAFGSAALTGPVSLTTIMSFGVVGLAAAVVTGELAGAYLLVGSLLLVALLAIVVGIVAALRTPRLGYRAIARARRLHPRIHERADGWRETWRRVARRGLGPAELAPVVGWSVVKWAADVASLALVFVAFGETPRVTVLLVGFAASQVGAAVPVTPGGVGFVEGGMVTAFVALGLTLSSATSVVVVYRLLEAWLPSVAGLPMLLRPPEPPATEGDDPERHDVP
jgi:uncharacterized protein (TIRG00374 family)